jgi:hypothetical protein
MEKEKVEDSTNGGPEPDAQADKDNIKARNEVDDEELEDLEELVEEKDQDEAKDTAAVSFSESDTEDKSVSIAWDAIESRPDSENSGEKERKPEQEKDIPPEESEPASDGEERVDEIVRDEVVRDDAMEIPEDEKDDEGLAQNVNEIADFMTQETISEEMPKVEEPVESKKATKRKSGKKKPTSKRPKKDEKEKETVLTPSSSSKRVVKPVQNWRKVLRLPSSTNERLDSAQIFQSPLPAYVPHVPHGTSQRLIEYLTDKDVDMLCCPGCKDRFILPTTFFQHVYRRSISIAFSCQSCQDTINFLNSCHLKMHVLSHMETDGIASVSAEHCIVSPLSKDQLDTCFVDGDFKRELNLVHESVSAFKEVDQCPECKLTIEKEGLGPHFQRVDAPHECSQCPMVLSNTCSLSTHSRIHERKPAFVCPECGANFDTFPVFQRHVENSCHHEAKVLVFTCKICVKSEGKNASVAAADLLSHFYDYHVKLFYKCTSCPKAFATKSAIYSHREDKHSKEDKLNKSDFSLLYKATFLKAPGNLFNTRDAFEEKMMALTMSWPSSVSFKCGSCQTYFSEMSEYEKHNRKWCSLQTGHMDKTYLFEKAKNSSPSDDRKAKAERLILELKELLTEPNCISCEDSLARLQAHVSDHSKHEVTTSSVIPDRAATPIVVKDEINHIPSDLMEQERKLPPPKRPLRSMSKEAVNSKSSSPAHPTLAKKIETPKPVPTSVETKLGPGVPTNKPVKFLNNKKVGSGVGAKKPPPEKEGVKPFVETLGKDLPSTRRMLAYNRYMNISCVEM